MAIIFGDLSEEDALLPAGLVDLVIKLKGQQGNERLNQGGLPLQAQSTTVTLFLPPDLKVDTYYNFGPTPDDPE